MSAAGVVLLVAVVLIVLALVYYLVSVIFALQKITQGLDDTISAVSGADATVLVTEWDEFRTMDLQAVAEAMAGDVLIDGRNALDPEAVRAAGLTYEGIGRS